MAETLNRVFINVEVDDSVAADAGSLDVAGLLGGGGGGRKKIPADRSRE